MEPAVRKEVGRRIDAIEISEDVSVLYACESGSRAWGFPSSDSDFDVRFLYLRRPSWYLSVALERRRDVIESSVDGPWDVNGWDLRKALQLLRKSNPPLLEWLRSPIIYREHERIVDDIRALVPKYYSPNAALYHYWHMASKNVREYLCGHTVRRKKYFYVLRPLLACRWIEQDLGPVPMEFERLVDKSGMDEAIRAAIAELLVLKRSGSEFDSGPRIAPISDYIDAELARVECIAPKPGSAESGIAPLDRLFQSALRSAFPNNL